MSHIKDVYSVGKGSAKIIQTMEPLAERKNPALAFILGLLFGALGVAIYFKSTKDFMTCFGMFLAASVLLPGIGTLLGWFFAPCYGAFRAHSSNEQLNQ